MTENLTTEYREILAEICTELSSLAQSAALGADKTGAVIGEDTDLLGDLALGSLQVMDLLLKIEDRFDVSIPVSILPDVKTVRDLAREVETLVRER
jgi:acyl carrier protein